LPLISGGKRAVLEIRLVAQRERDLASDQFSVSSEMASLLNGAVA